MHTFCTSAARVESYTSLQVTSATRAPFAHAGTSDGNRVDEGVVDGVVDETLEVVEDEGVDDMLESAVVAEVDEGVASGA